jgi:hypothetical protein
MQISPSAATLEYKKLPVLNLETSALQISLESVRHRLDSIPIQSLYLDKVHRPGVDNTLPGHQTRRYSQIQFHTTYDSRMYFSLSSVWLSNNCNTASYISKY